MVGGWDGDGGGESGTGDCAVGGTNTYSGLSGGVSGGASDNVEYGIRGESG